MALTRTTCPSCHAVLKLSTPIPPGKRLKCPRCSTAFPADGEETPPPAPKAKQVRPAAAGAVPKRGHAGGASARGGVKAAAPGIRTRPTQEDVGDEAGQDDEEEERAPRRRTARKGKSRQAGLALRVSALILGVIGGLFSGGLGVAWLGQASSPEVKAMRELAKNVAGVTDSKELKDNLARLDRMVWSSYFLLLAVPLGVAGGVLALLGRAKLGGALMLAAVPVPLALSVLTLMPLYFLLVGGLLALLMPSWPPGGGPTTGVMALLTAGGWILVLVGWVVVLLALPKPPEVSTPSEPAVIPPARPGPAPGTTPNPQPPGPAAGTNLAPAPGKRVEVFMGIDGYPDVTKRGVSVGQTVKVKGHLYMGEDGRVSLSLARLYDGPAPAVSAVELTRAAARDRAAAEKKYQRPDGSTIVEGVVAELNPGGFTLALQGARD